MRDHTDPAFADPLIEEVRQLRRRVCEAVGNDVDRLCDELLKVEQEFRTRTGRFGDIPRERAADVLFPGRRSGQPTR